MGEFSGLFRNFKPRVNYDGSYLKNLNYHFSRDETILHIY